MISEERKTDAWPKDRIKEMDSALTILTALRGLNHGSGFLDKIQGLIERAERLDKLDLENARPSFSQFLVSQAAGEGGVGDMKTKLLNLLVDRKKAIGMSFTDHPPYEEGQLVLIEALVKEFGLDEQFRLAVHGPTYDE